MPFSDYQHLRIEKHDNVTRVWLGRPEVHNAFGQLLIEELWSAFLRIEGLEHYAKIVMAARAAGPIEPLPDDKRIELLTLWGLEHLEVPA